MLTAFSTARHMDWSGWFTGILRACITGGAGSIASAFGALTADPNRDFVPGVRDGGAHLFHLMWITFAFAAFIHLCMYLQTHPLPETIVVDAPSAKSVNVSLHPGDQIKIEQKK